MADQAEETTDPDQEPETEKTEKAPEHHDQTG